MRAFCIAAVAAFAVDQFSKWLIVWRMDLIGQGRIEVLPPFLNFHMAWNTGVNFGLFGTDAQVMRWVLIALAVGISAWLAVYARRHFTRAFEQVLAGLIVGGALGNALDRVLFGAVADFLNMSCCGIANPFAFNLADVAVFAGALGLVFFARTADKAP